MNTLHTNHSPTDAGRPDDEFSQPYIDVDEWRDEPIRRRYVHGGFTGTETRFSVHLPPSDRYDGRFFQYITPVPDSEHFSEGRTGEEDKISFAGESGAIFVETNGGGPPAADPFSGVDPTIGAYRANAAVARYVRVLAQEMYGAHRTYGYAFGGSGGGFRTVGGAENTSGAWDGFVPYVLGSPVAIPNCFTARMHALRVIGDRFDDIVDAFEPGGSGDPSAHLDHEQLAAFTEVTRMGFPPRSWIAHRTMGMHALAVLYPGVRAMDPSYFDDFWTAPGYLGADGSPSLARDRVQHETRIVQLLGASDLDAAGIDAGDRPGESTGAADDAWRGSRVEATVAVRVADAPAVDPQAAELIVTTGDASDARIVVTRMIGDIALFGPADPYVVSRLAVGDGVIIDNSGFLALQTYHRHQVPSTEFTVWDQFRNEDGTPLYPQRPFLVGPIFAAGAAGSVQRGAFEGRMIVVESLLDREAYPWQADWYRRLVREHGGESRLRVWMTDNALHGDFECQEHPTHTVSYLGQLNQALRDVAAWVEGGVEPPESTAYHVEDGQVIVPAGAMQRRGIQPVVTLDVDGSERAVVEIGQEVTLTARAQTPDVGVIVAIDWDLDGSGDFAVSTTVDASSSVEASLAHTYVERGAHFPTVRVTAHRDGRTDTVFARLHNLARARVVVA